MNSFLRNKHLLLRAGFGLDFQNIQKLKQASSDEICRILQKDSLRYKPLDVPEMENSYL